MIILNSIQKKFANIIQIRPFVRPNPDYAGILYEKAIIFQKED